MTTTKTNTTVSKSAPHSSGRFLQQLTTNVTKLYLHLKKWKIKQIPGGKRMRSLTTFKDAQLSLHKIARNCPPAAYHCVGHWINEFTLNQLDKMHNKTWIRLQRVPWPSFLILLSLFCRVFHINASSENKHFCSPCWNWCSNFLRLKFSMSIFQCQ